MSRPLASALLVVATVLWGFAFVAQKSAMSEVGPLTFAGIRYLIGGLVILPLAIWEYRRRKAAPTRKQLRLLGIVCAAFFFGSWLQQAGLQFTTATNAGFLTALYVLVVPVLALVALKSPPHPVTWVGAPLALVGVYWLNGGGLGNFNGGDLLVVISAAFWGMHVLALGLLARATGLPIAISSATFIAAGLLAMGGAFVSEAPRLAAIVSIWPQIAYAALLSTSLAFTLQAVAQQYVPPANTAIILSGESLFAALGGALILGERLPVAGYAGATLILCAIVLVEAVPPWLAQRARRSGA